jgi:hypothetical protein
MARNLTSQLVTITEADMFEGGDATVKYHLKAITFEVADAMRTMSEDGATRLLEFLTMCLVSWEGVTVDGVPAPCDPAHFKLLDTEVADVLCARMFQLRAEREAARMKSFREATAVR